MLARAAGMDWFEQGQTWHEVAQSRTATVDPARVTALSPAVRTLLETQIEVGDSQTQRIAALAFPYADAGGALRDLDAPGELHRGIRAVCASHVLFASNRLGVPYEQQSQMVATARELILGSTATNAQGPNTAMRASWLTARIRDQANRRTS